MWARPAILAAALCAVGPAEATDGPSTPTLMALSALEILRAELRNPDATLVDVVRDAAATVAFPRDAAGDTLASLIRQVLSAGGEGELHPTRTEIEAGAASFTSLKPELISRFTSELLTRTRTALEQEGEKAFLDELLGEAADAVGIDERAGASLTRNLVSIAARVLRPRPPLQVSGLSEGVYVLAVSLRVSGKVEFQGYEYEGSRWDAGMLEWGTSYLVETLGKSMALRRRFRRIVPGRSDGGVKSLLADFLLVVDISGQSWREIADSRKVEAKPEDILSWGSRERRSEDRVMELTLTLESSIETLPGGNRIWTQKHTAKRYGDELAGRAAVLNRDSVFEGILDLVANQTRVELARLW